ncbi:MAG: type II toxin-antitoxin system HicB family antitoxin [Syntrophobacteraceae bacterium]
MKDNTLHYKGFSGSVRASIEDSCLHGRILFIEDLVTYEADTIPQLKTEFESAVDDYLITCQRLGRKPNKPLSGTFNVRIGPELHQKVARHAALNGTTINDVVKKAVAEFIKDPERYEVVHKHYPESVSSM